MGALLKSKKTIEYIIFILIIALGILIFIPAIQKPIPPGVDAATYINDVNWIFQNKTLPKPYQSTYHSFFAYPSQGTDINLFVWSVITGLNVVYPLFSLYQVFLIILLIGSSYLVGGLYSRRVAILFPIALIGSFSIIRLFIGSTVSNLLAFSFVNIIFYCVFQYIVYKNKRMIPLTIIILFGLFITHGYLTAPIFIPIFLLYLLYLLFVSQELKTEVVAIIKSVRRFVFIFGLFILLFFLAYLFLYYRDLFTEAINSFLRPSQNEKFREVIRFAQYGSHLGPFLFQIGALGLLLYLARWKENLLSFRILPIFWIGVLALLLQTYRFGVDFFFERLVFLGGVFFALFAAYGVDALTKLRRMTHLPVLIPLTIALFSVLAVSSGANQVRTLYASSNKVQPDHIQALKIVQVKATIDDMVFSNENAVSQTVHDVMIANRDFAYLKIGKAHCSQVDTACHAFNEPDRENNIQFFRENNIQFFLLMKPSVDGDALVDNLRKVYQNSEHYDTIFLSSNAALFKLNSK